MQEKGELVLGSGTSRPGRTRGWLRKHSPRARQKSRKASWAWTPQAWSFSRGGNSLTSASRPPSAWEREEEEEEAAEEDGKAEDVWLPEPDRLSEVSAEGEAAMRTVENKRRMRDNEETRGSRPNHRGEMRKRRLRQEISDINKEEGKHDSAVWLSSRGNYAILLLS